ncbi:MAG: hypothetical protein JW726_00170 [Anaerolineales bacterium]|nr:hypothetical protein [Anaerolineales bacterium]
MSGICGVIHFDGAPVDPALLQKMAQAAAYRAPDGIRYWVEGNIGFAHLAFYTTPESQRERQPLHNATNDLTLVADARLDNRDELIPFLSAKGLVQPLGEDGFSPTDADLILASYAHWGAGCPAHLIGDFAFALWDARSQSLFAAADQQAMRIIHYRYASGVFQFATDALQLLEDPAFPVQLNEEMVRKDLILPDMGGQRESYYLGVHKLAAAERLFADRQGLRTEQYWDYDPSMRIRYSSDEEYAEHFLHLFQRAVRDRLRSTRPVLLFMSGGHDSTAIAAIAAEQLAQNPAGLTPSFQPVTFTSQAFPLEEELASSRLVAQHSGLQLQEVCVDDAPVLADCPPYAPQRDEPGDVIFRPYFVEALRRLQPGPVVCMTGSGGDSVVGAGNPYHYLQRLRSAQILAFTRDLLEHSRLQGVSPGWLLRNMLLVPLLVQPIRESLSRWRGRLLPGSSKIIPPWVQVAPEQRAALLAWVWEQPSLGFIVPSRELLFSNDRALELRYRLLKDARSVRIHLNFSRMFAAFGAESWSPWDDIRLGQFALAIPPEQLTLGIDRKRILRRALRQHLPAQVLERILLKTGPEVWVKAAYQKKETLARADQLLLNSQGAQMGIIKPADLRRELERVQRGQASFGYRIWLPFALEIWLRLYFQ